MNLLLNKNIAKIIVCPYCKGRIKLFKNVYRCLNCKKDYTIENGIPYFTQEYRSVDKRITNNSMSREMKQKFFNVSSLYKIRRRIEGLFFLSEDRMINLTEKYRNRVKGLVLNVGSGIKNESNRDINLDIDAFPNVSVVGDGHYLPFKNDCVDMVVNRYVLEHVRDPKKVVLEMHRVLKKNGYVYVEVPFMQRFHGYPYDFQRFTKLGLEELMKDFKKVEIGVAGGPSIAFIEHTVNYLRFIAGGNILIFLILFLPVSIPLILLKFIDIKKNQHPTAHELSISLYYIGKKI